MFKSYINKTISQLIVTIKPLRIAKLFCVKRIVVFGVLEPRIPKISFGLINPTDRWEI